MGTLFTQWILITPSITIHIFWKHPHPLGEDSQSGDEGNSSLFPLVSRTSHWQFTVVYSLGDSNSAIASTRTVPRMKTLVQGLSWKIKRLILIWKTFPCIALLKDTSFRCCTPNQLLSISAFSSSGLEWVSGGLWGLEDGREPGAVRGSVELPSQSPLGPLCSVGPPYKAKPQNFSAEFVPKLVALLVLLPSSRMVLRESPITNQSADLGHIL